jgi:uncharacterized membrane protein
MVKKKENNTFLKIWENIYSEVPNAFEKLKESWESLFRKKTLKEKRKRNPWAIAGLICLNLFIMIALWFSLFAVIISLFFSGVAISISGLAIILSSLFVIIMPITFALQGLFVSSLFSGIGVFCLGIIISIFGWKFGKYFFILTKKYLNWNNRVFSGRSR